jgi:hypothetical protein
MQRRSVIILLLYVLIFVISTIVFGGFISTELRLLGLFISSTIMCLSMILFFIAKLLLDK